MTHAGHITIAYLVVMTVTQSLSSCRQDRPQQPVEPNLPVQKDSPMKTATNLTEDQWKQKLTPIQYHVLREKGTERAFTGKYNMHFKDGLYHCAACGAPLFASDSKFKTDCGWPGFSQPIDKNSVTETLDTSHGMKRIEITCSHCGSHLGHVFNDGPAPTGLRYCINSVSIDFEVKEGKQ